MKRIWVWTLPAFICCVLGSAVQAAVEEGTWAVTLGCQHCTYEKDTGASTCGAAGKIADKVYVLKGDAMKAVDYEKGGQYKVTGKLDTVAKTIEVTKIQKVEKSD